MNRTTWPSIAGEVGLDDGSSPDDICFFSGAGPTATGVPKPDVLAPGGFVVGAMSVDADPRTHTDSIFDPGTTCPGGAECFVIDEGYAITSGTSMSAPHVTGGVALLLDQTPTLTQAQVTTILQASARLPTGSLPYQSQIGPGAMNLANALDAMNAESGTPTAPDTNTSWWTLSSELASPDPSQQVSGTIELRHTDGSIADGLDGTKLTVLAVGGTVASPPAKVSHGLFRFAVSGQPGAGGTDMEVTVLYDGAPIGPTRKVPIALDEWIGSGTPVATGGCESCAIGRMHDGDDGVAAWIACATALVFVRRRPRH